MGGVFVISLFVDIADFCSRMYSFARRALFSIHTQKSTICDMIPAKFSLIHGFSDRQMMKYGQETSRYSFMFSTSLVSTNSSTPLLTQIYENINI